MQHAHIPQNYSNCILTEWPSNVLTGLSLPSSHTCIHMSVEHEANSVLLFQSTSRAGAVWNANCCLLCPVCASQIIVVWRQIYNISWKLHEIICLHLLRSLANKQATDSIVTIWRLVSGTIFYNISCITYMTIVSPIKPRMIFYILCISIHN